MTPTSPESPDIAAITAQIVDDIVAASVGVLANYDTETLKSVADGRDRIRKDGWLQQMIREYIDAWR